MSKRQLLFLLLIVIVFLTASGVPNSSLNSGWRHYSDTALIVGRNINMVSGTKLPDGDPWLQRQNEPSIAVSTRNPLHLLAGANDYRTIDMPEELTGEIPGQEEKKTAQAIGREPWLGVFKSFDGGQSWITTLLPGCPLDTTLVGTSSPLYTQGWEAAADPVVRAGPNGLFYYSGIAFHRVTKEGVVFVSRFIDNNNKEKGDCIKYLDTKIIARGLWKVFLDKPWIAVDKPRLPFWKITIDGQRIQRHNVYIAFSAFTGEGNNLTSKIMFARSNDCGENWSVPIQISKGNYAYQGATIAIKPILGSVFVAWRKFGDAGQPNQEIYVANSIILGLSFDKPVKVASFYSFDQASSGGTFRTNSYPTIAIDSLDRVYVAWSQRMGSPDAQARIVISTSILGYSWTKPKPIDTSGDGHQIMPSLTFAGGKLMAVWYDQREDYSQRFTKYIDDISGEKRHTLDVRVAQANPSLNPVFEPSLQVSRYHFVLKDDGTLQQVQFNPVNYPLFKGGTWPFTGDYIDISPAPMFILGPYGYWQFNTAPSNSTVFHVAWTDNRDVRPPQEGSSWADYHPPNSDQEGLYYQNNSCVSYENAGMRNQNVYTSSITKGIIIGSPGNTKPLGTLGKTLDGVGIPRAFVVLLKNTTNETKSFRLSIANQPRNGRASFLEFDNLFDLDVEIPSYSSISRSVFVYSSNPKATVRIDVAEIDAPYGQPVSGGLESYVLLNPEIENPEIENPEIENPEIENPDILVAEVHNPEIETPEIINWDYSILNPEIINPEIENPEIINPEIINPEIENPEIENPEIINPEIENPNIDDPSAGQFTDVIWKLKNAGNTTSSYMFKTLSTAAREDGTLPEGILAQLLVYRVYKTPAEHGSSSDASCDLREQQHHELILNIINPEIENPEIENPEIENPEIENPEIENATFNLEPDGEALVLLRLWKPDNPPTSSVQSLSSFKTLGTNNINSNTNDIFSSLVGYASSTSRNTTELQEGIPTYPAAASELIITTKILSYGKVGQFYRDFLTAAGGAKPYSWSIPSGSLPDGVIPDSATGEISGTPTTAGTFSFTAQVKDAEGENRTLDCWITIFSATVGGYTISGRVTVNGSGLPEVEMNLSSGNLVTTDSAGYYSISVSPGWSGTVTPAKSGYTFSPDSQSYENVISNQTMNYTATALDVTLPSVLAFNPPDDALNVPIAKDLKITFSENVVVGSGYIVIHRSSDDTTFETINATDTSKVSVSANIATINPAGIFESLTSYYVRIEGSSFKDTAGNLFAGILDKTTWNFTTAPDLEAGLVAYYPFNGNANDESGNSNHGTVHEAVLTDDRFGNLNSAYEFDGVNDYIEAQDSSTLDITDAITIAAWVKPDLNEITLPIVNKYRSAVEFRAYWLYGWTSGEPGPRFRVCTGANEICGEAYINELLPTASWSFVVGTYDGSNLKLYIDGALKANGSVTGQICTNSLPLRIGADNELPPYYFNGKIDDVRIYNRALSASEIQALYNLDTGLVAYYPFNGNANDESGNGNHGQASGATLTQDRFGNPDSAYYFDGVDNYIEIPDNDTLDITNAITITAWIKPTDLTKLYQYVVVKRDDSPPDGPGGNVYDLDIYPGKVRSIFHYQGGGSTTKEATGNTSIIENIWQHIAVTWDGTIITVYYNGQPDGTGPFSGLIKTSGRRLEIGSYSGGAATFFKGIIDEVRIYNRALSASEIQALYMLIK
jgi:hypothetical protein